MVCVAGTRIIEPSSRPHTKRHCMGKKMVAVSGDSVSGFASNWLRTPGGFGSMVDQISSRLLVIQG